jgi:hypothetical protein
MKVCEFRRWFIFFLWTKLALCNVFHGGWCDNDVNTCNPPPNGAYERCEMCICENLNKFVPGATGCSNNNILYACYISYRSTDNPPIVGCQVELKTSWLIGFIAASSFVCTLFCIAIGVYYCSSCKRSHSKVNYQIDENSDEEEDLEINSDPTK